jgi:2'-5' RNA ligase
MPFALSVKSVNASAGAIVSLWDQVSVFEDLPSMRALNYPPHITFAIYDAPEVSKEVVIAAIENAAMRHSTIEITFNRIRTFEGPSLILWADPEPKEALLEMHRKIHAAISPEFCRIHYRPTNWIPHCTLAMRTARCRNADALAFAAAFRGDTHVAFDVVDCVALQPLKVVAEAPLSAPKI